MDQYLAAQPIFDVDESILACELLHHKETEPSSDTGVSPEASASLIVSLLESGLDHVTDGRPALIAISEEMLRERITKLLPAERVILQVSAQLIGTAEYAAACEELTAAGYTIAVDDFRSDMVSHPVLDLATYVKFDTTTASPDDLEAGVRAAHDRSCRPIATCVDRMSTWEAARDAGFELFQGRFFRDTELTARRESPAVAMNVVRLLSAVRDPNNSDTDLEEILKTDPNLAFKLLKIVNSAAMGGKGVDSIAHAIRLLGRQALYQWLSVLAVSAVPSRHDTDRELAMTALLRGRFLESVGSVSSGVMHEGHLFLTGLFSVMDALVGLDFREIAESAALPDGVEPAVLHREGSYGMALTLVEAYEVGDWPVVSATLGGLDLDDCDLSSAYLDAMTRSQQQLQAA